MCYVITEQERSGIVSVGPMPRTTTQSLHDDLLLKHMYVDRAELKPDSKAISADSRLDGDLVREVCTCKMHVLQASSMHMNEFWKHHLSTHACFGNIIYAHACFGNIIYQHMHVLEASSMHMNVFWKHHLCT